jgi:hypothetical protein
MVTDKKIKRRQPESGPDPVWKKGIGLDNAR